MLQMDLSLEYWPQSVGRRGGRKERQPLTVEVIDRSGGVGGDQFTGSGRSCSVDLKIKVSTNCPYHAADIEMSFCKSVRCHTRFGSVNNISHIVWEECLFDRLGVVDAKIVLPEALFRSFQRYLYGVAGACVSEDMGNRH
jgi:hypothetical protein